MDDGDVGGEGVGRSRWAVLASGRRLKGFEFSKKSKFCGLICARPAFCSAYPVLTL